MHDVLERFAIERCSAILRTEHADAVGPAMRAAVDGGFRIVEFTLNTPGALEHIAEYADNPNVVVGAGTVLSEDDARSARRAGAQFLVAPNIRGSVIRYAARFQLPILPGAHTPTEMHRAHRLGAPMIKVFPAVPGGPDYLRAVLGPMPFLKLFPTAGVTEHNVGEWFAAGAIGAGFVKPLFDPEDLAAGRFDAIRERAATLYDAVRSAAEANPATT